MLLLLDTVVNYTEMLFEVVVVAEGVRTEVAFEMTLGHVNGLNVKTQFCVNGESKKKEICVTVL